ncbi:MAG TPA: DUF4832 domain-containing protein [Prolixibacteraceae bacterium]|nr:DUF4832 domain-containing protein [Prolixibacteraceae bacterium]
MKNIKTLLTVVLAVCVFVGFAQNEESVTIKPKVFEHALNNPLKGFRPGLNTAKSGDHPFSSVVRTYIKWNELERNENDSIEQIIKICDQKWGGVASNNIKIIPRVYLDWDGTEGNEYWPKDLNTGDYTSDEFEQRLTRLVKRLGKVWDNDPRVAWIQMGIIGYWGEHHHPAPTAGQQKLLGDLFTEAFKNKKVLVRQPFSEFTDYQFGWYWDSFAHWDQINTQAKPMMEKCPDRWKVAPIEGETAYNWGDYEIQPGGSPSETLSDPSHRKWLINYIRKLHCTALGWVASFDVHNPVVVAGADEVQKAFGYRYILKEVTYPKKISINQPFTISFKVENTGSAPFYYNWPVELRLLDSNTHETKWKQVFNTVDIRTWMPGEDWSESLQAYKIEAPIVNNIDTFQIDSDITKGEYILALSILDPAGMVPAVKFATTQYFNGGLHPVGYIGVDTVTNRQVIDSMLFNTPIQDKSLRYSDERGEIVDDVPSEIIHKPSRKTFNNESWSFPGDSLFAWQYDYMLSKKRDTLFALDTAQTIGVYGCNDTSGFNIRAYADSTVNKDAAQFNWNSSTQTFQTNGQWLEYSVVFDDADELYQLIVKARNNIAANFRLTVSSAKGDTVLHKDFNLTRDFKNVGGGNEYTDWFQSNSAFKNLWGSYVIKFDWYDNIGEPGVFGGFAFVKSELDITPPEWYYVSIGNINQGTDITVMTTEDGKVYLVPEGTSPDTTAIQEAAVAVMDVTAYSQVKLATDELIAGNYVAYALDSSNNVSEASRMITIQTAVTSSAFRKNSDITIFYNSVDEQIKIKSNSQLSRIDVYNILGKKVGSVTCMGNTCNFHANELFPGIYLVRLITNNGIIATKKIGIK